MEINCVFVCSIANFLSVLYLLVFREEKQFIVYLFIFLFEYLHYLICYYLLINNNLLTKYISYKFKKKIEDNRKQNNGTVSGRMDISELTDEDSQLPDVQIKRPAMLLSAKFRNFDCTSILSQRIRNIILLFVMQSFSFVTTTSEHPYVCESTYWISRQFYTMMVLEVMLSSRRNPLRDNHDPNAVSCLRWKGDYLKTVEVCTSGGAKNVST